MAASNCFIPHDVILCILTRLPVKSIIRFKSVCKPWRELFSTPEFIKMHQHQFSGDPKNQSFILEHSADPETQCLGISLLSSIDSINEKKPMNLPDTCSESWLCPYGAQIVGCCNGLVCISGIVSRDRFVLWNPALKAFKFVPPSGPLLNDYNISFGFGYDAEEADFKVVILDVQFGMRNVGLVAPEFFVYSANSDSWKTIKLACELSVDYVIGKNNAIVNGNPYWEAIVDGEDVLAWFDVRKSVFKITSLPALDLKRNWPYPYYVPLHLMEYKGCVGILVPSINIRRIESFDFWVLSDDEKQIWTKNLTFRFKPTEIAVKRFWQCSKNGGKIIGLFNNGELIVFNTETKCVEGNVFGETPKFLYDIYQYTESLAYVKGMKQQ